MFVGRQAELASLSMAVVAQLHSRATGSNASGSLNECTTSPSPSVFSVGAELLSILGSLDRSPTVVAVDDAHWLDQELRSSLA